MTCNDARPAMDALLDGELPAGEEASLRAHLEECAACARDLEERRAFSGSLAESFGRGLEGVRPAPGERERVAGRAASAARRRVLLPARLAAAVAVAVALGLVAHAFHRSLAREREQVAALLEEKETRRQQIDRLHEEIGRDLTFVHGAVNPDPAGPSAPLLAAVGANAIAARLDPRGAPPAPDPKERLSITQTAGSGTVRFIQRADGRVTLVVPGRTIEARSVGDLKVRHPEVCRQFAITGRDGFVLVSGNAAAVDLKGQLDLMVRTGSWHEDLQWEAYRAWVAGRSDAEERLDQVRERCRRAAESAAVPPVTVDAREIVRKVDAYTRRELEAARLRVEEEMKSLEARLKEARELHGRARSLRVYAENLKQK